MAFYHFLAIFPSLLLFLAISARVPHLGNHMKNVLQDLSGEVLPDPASQLLKEAMEELNRKAVSGLQLIPASAGALWAALNGTLAMVYGLNKAYDVEEHRPWWKLGVTIVGLTSSLAVSGSTALFLIFCGTRLQAQMHASAILLRGLQWIVVSGLLGLSFAILYRFAPNLRDHEWRWSTPGALGALLVWIGSTMALRAYFTHVNDYSRSYGSLNRVVMLMLWLYVANGAILIGGEMNSEIEKAAAACHEAPKRSADEPDRSGS